MMKNLIYFLLIWVLLSCKSSLYQSTHHSTLEEHNSMIPQYSRKQWSHWIDKDNNCLNTRQELLKSRSLTPIVLSKNGCRVISGTWDDYYYPERLFLTKDIDIDHVIPLKHAHQNGGYKWSFQQKEEFANDFENLVITNKLYNRKKGSQGIDKWLPAKIEYACKYAKNWFYLKKKYQLTITDSEINSAKQLILQGCSLPEFPH